MQNTEKKIIITSDGSPTIYLPELNEHYHSVHGAIQESVFVYIDNALNLSNNKKIKLFEIGFGTGLNAYLSCLESERKNIDICYHSIEMYPLQKCEWLKLAGYFKGTSEHEDLFKDIHICEWDKEVQITGSFRLKKIKGDLTKFHFHDTYDVIYFDAFAPEVQQEMWTEEIFRKISGIMNKGAVLSTYSAKGQVRRNLRSAGLLVNRIPGPPGKKEITVASKNKNE